MTDSVLLQGLNPEQIEVVTHNEGPLFVVAGPGSGKTRALVHRIAYLMIERGVSGTEILATTFSKKAAEQMNERLALLVGAAGAGWGSNTCCRPTRWPGTPGAATTPCATPVAASRRGPGSTTTRRWPSTASGS
jgi:hypothetical protein